MTHGTVQGYRKGCREQCCRSAFSAYCKSNLAVRKAKGQFKHGTSTGYYSYGCRCQPCGLAGREYDRKRQRTDRPPSSLLSIELPYRPTPTSITTLTREQELEILIAQQARDMKYGHQIGRNPKQVSLDWFSVVAPGTHDILTHDNLWGG